MAYKVSVVIEKDENGYYAYCPQLAGCHSQGDTFEQVAEHIEEAIALYLETLSAEEKQACLSRQVFTSSVEVEVA